MQLLQHKHAYIICLYICTSNACIIHNTLDETDNNSGGSDGKGDNNDDDVAEMCFHNPFSRLVKIATHSAMILTCSKLECFVSKLF